MLSSWLPYNNHERTTICHPQSSPPLVNSDPKHGAKQDGRVSKAVKLYNRMSTWVEALVGEVTSFFVLIELLVSGGLGSSE
jgi:hypothetical protein